MPAEKKRSSPFVQPIFIATKHDTNNKGPDACSSCIFVPLCPLPNSEPYGWCSVCMYVCVWMHLVLPILICVRAASRIAYVIRSLCLIHSAHATNNKAVSAGIIIDPTMFTIFVNTYFVFQFGCRVWFKTIVSVCSFPRFFVVSIFWRMPLSTTCRSDDPKLPY